MEEDQTVLETKEGIKSVAETYSAAHSGTSGPTNQKSVGVS
jgi:hypothetical protein